MSTDKTPTDAMIETYDNMRLATDTRTWTAFDFWLEGRSGAEDEAAKERAALQELVDALTAPDAISTRFHGGISSRLGRALEAAMALLDR